MTYLCNLGFTCYINVDFKVELIMLNFLLQIFQVIHMYNDFVISFISVYNAPCKHRLV